MDILKIFKYFWLKLFFIYFLVAGSSYFFLTKLFFWREDYRLIYSYFSRQLYEGWPYQGINLVYFPFISFFHTQPLGYFLTIIFSYAILSTLVAFLGYELTANKLVAFLAGLLFSVGYIGSENQILIMASLDNIFYLTLVIVFVLSYKVWLQSTKHGLTIYFLYILALVVFSHRAHDFFGIVLLTDVYFSLKSGNLNLKKITKSLKRLLPFFIISLVSYLAGPFIFKNDVISGPTPYTQLISGLPHIFNQNFFIDMGNFLISSELRESLSTRFNVLNLYSGIAVGILWISTIFGFLIFSKNKAVKLTTAYLSLVYFISYVIYHLTEWNLVHPSWHRYLFLGFPFFSILFVNLLYYIFWKNKKLTFRLLGSVIFIFILLTNLISNRISSFTTDNLERSADAVSFFNQMKSYIPNIPTKTLIYIDSVNNSNIQSSIGKILGAGVFPQETALAAVYSTDLSNLKVVYNYTDIAQYKDKYRNFYSFFYDQDKKLINTTDLITSKQPENYTNESLPNYSSKISKNPDKTIFSNQAITLPAKELSVKPVSVILNISLSSLLPVNNYPLIENGADNQVPDNQKSKLLNYLKERYNFQKVVQISSSGSEKPSKNEDAIDGDPQTSWLSNKKDWLNGHPQWLQFNFSQPYQVSEIRWESNNGLRLPTAYKYQYFDSAKQSWVDIISKDNYSIKAGGFVVDDFKPITAQSFRMIITKTNTEDFPAVSEIELLSDQFTVSSDLANLFLQHPFSMVNSPVTASETFDGLKDYFVLDIYPISDKYPDLIHSVPVKVPIFVDGQPHTYNFTLPAGGTYLNKLVILPPNIPLQINIQSISLTSGVSSVIFPNL